MLDVLKTLLNNNVVSEELEAEIREAWDKKLKETRLEVTKELRNEFAQKYEHDKAVMAEAVQDMVEERLTTELNEFHLDREQLNDAKARHLLAVRESKKALKTVVLEQQAKVRKHTNLMKTFIAEQLAKEVKDLHLDQKTVAKNIDKIKNFVLEQLTNELNEFQQDKDDLADYKIKMIRENHRKFTKLKEKFIKESSKLVYETTQKTLKRELTQLKSDIHEARKNDFGRKIFETFANEYSVSYLNEKSDVSKLSKLIAIKDKQLTETKKLAVKAKQIAEHTVRDKKRLVEAQERRNVIHELTSPLTQEQKVIMRELLESVQTSRLETKFNEYLPKVVSSSSETKVTKPVDTKTQLNEDTTRTKPNKSVIEGNRTNNSSSNENVVELRRLAGL